MRPLTMIWIDVVVGVGVGAQQIARPILKGRRMRHEIHAVALETFGNEESAALYTDLLEPITTDPRLEKHVRQLQAASSPSAPLKGPGRTGVADLIAAGMVRLEPADQVAIFDVKVALAEKSPALCAGFWTGSVPSTALTESMRNLDRSQQRSWIAISARALTRELEADGTPPPAPGPAAQDAMAELVQSLSAEEQAAFGAAAAAQGAPTQDVACRAFRALAAGMRKTTDEKRAAILRLLGASSGRS
jgi:hypothetical protein